ncbi:hypothetical protein EI94DRAFT_1788429 [Lactarius quietus]|nr:hypothetical protein EI94DRAFT_1788429 [Lactarius quietus]
MNEREREHHEIPEADNPWEDFADDDDDAGPPPRHAVAILDPGLLGALPQALGADVFRYISDILGTVFRVLKIPIPLALAIISCIYIISLALGAIRTALAPICSVPIISLACPAFVSIKPNTPPKPDFPGLLNIEYTNLESLFEDTVEGLRLALKMTEVEMETRGLATLVRISNLNSREVLADSLGKFVKDARKASRGLTRFSSRVRVALDKHVVPLCLESAIEAADTKSSLSRLLPFGLSESATKQVVLRTFTEAMNTLPISMQRLVYEAEVSASDLNRLEEHLKSIHKVVSRADSRFYKAIEDLLAYLWTKIGGDGKEFRKMEERRALLKDVGKYRDRARDHVVEALQYLEKAVEDMKELRDRMAAPQLVGKTVPIDIHIMRLRGGLERLKERRASTRTVKKKSQNMESIMLCRDAGHDRKRNAKSVTLKVTFESAKNICVEVLQLSGSGGEDACV